MHLPMVFHCIWPRACVQQLRNLMTLSLTGYGKQSTANRRWSCQSCNSTWPTGLAQVLRSLLLLSHWVNQKTYANGGRNISTATVKTYVVVSAGCSKPILEDILPIHVNISHLTTRKLLFLQMIPFRWPTSKVVAGRYVNGSISRVEM